MPRLCWAADRSQPWAADGSQPSTHLHIVVVIVAALHDVHAALDRRRWQAHMHIAEPRPPARAARR